MAGEKESWILLPSAIAGFFVLKCQTVRHRLNNLFCYEPVILIGSTAIAIHIIHRFYHQVPNDGVKQGLLRWFFRYIRNSPFVKKKILRALEKTKDVLHQDMLKLMRGKRSADGFDYILTLPNAGAESEDIISKLNEYMTLGGYSWRQKGFPPSAAFHIGDALTRLNIEVFKLSVWTDPCHPTAFPGVCKMEAEIVRMVANLFHGSVKTCGTVTSGANESIILAVKAYRDYATQEKDIQYPEILVPVTAHPAFDKAAQLLNLKIKHIPINLQTCQVDTAKMKKMITSNTCMLVGSAPAYPHGCIDDIQEIAALGLKYGIPVHVDAGLGGFLIAFMPAAGFNIPEFDFSLPGVTSISADTHTYGFAPKGSSVLLFRDISYKHRQYFFQSDWPGGIYYGTPTLLGSRSGAVIAGCWASMLFFGQEGYIESTKRIVTVSRKIEAGLRAITGIRIMGKPLMSTVAFTSDKFDIYQLSEGLNKRGWNVNNLQYPASVHICLTYSHTAPGVVEQFFSDVNQEIATLLVYPMAVSDAVGMYKSTQRIPDRSSIQEITATYLDTIYSTEIDVHAPRDF